MTWGSSEDDFACDSQEQIANTLVALDICGSAGEEAPEYQSLVSSLLPAEFKGKAEPFQGV